MENLLTSAVPKKFGESDAVMVANLVGLMLAIIIAIAVVLPVSQSIISGIENSTIPTTASYYGTVKSVLDVVPILLAVVPIVLVAMILL